MAEAEEGDVDAALSSALEQLSHEEAGDAPAEEAEEQGAPAEETAAESESAGEKSGARDAEPDVAGVAGRVSWDAEPDKADEPSESPVRTHCPDNSQCSSLSDDSFVLLRIDVHC